MNVLGFPSGQPYLVGCICWIQRGFPLNLFTLYVVFLVVPSLILQVCRFWGFPPNLTYIAGCIFGVPPQSSLILRVVFVRFLGFSPQSRLISLSPHLSMLGTWTNRLITCWMLSFFFLAQSQFLISIIFFHTKGSITIPNF